jgi:hypothetical protein
MICGVSGAGGRLVEAQEGLVLASQHGLHVRKELVAELGTVDVRAEPGQLVTAPAPTCDETLACHGGTRIMLVNAPPTGSPKRRRLLSFCTQQSSGAFSGEPSPQCYEPANLGQHMARGCTAAVTGLGKMGGCCGIVGGFGQER